MWVFTKKGFVSIVRHTGRQKKGTLIVRARDRAHLAALLPGRRILVTPDADYPFRAFASARDVAEMLELQALAIDYPNFKNAAAGIVYHDALAAVWGIMWRAFADIRPLPRAGMNGHDSGHVDAEEAAHP